MYIGLPKERKNGENRVALAPAHVELLVEEGHCVAVEYGAGWGAGFTNEQYKEAGGILCDQSTVWAHDLIVKVKEPLPEEYKFIRYDHIIFSYLHLAANKPLTEYLMKAGAVGIGFETVIDEFGHTPILEPMSIIAGRLAPQKAAEYLAAPVGPGILMSEANVVILGCGTAGKEAAYISAGMGANVVLVDLPHKINKIDLDIAGNLPDWNDFDNMQAHYCVSSDSSELIEELVSTDVIIGCVHVPGEPAAQLVTKNIVSHMREGSVIVDVAIDQGGCSETSRPTSHDDPVYFVDGVTHYCVPNMPGIVPRSATESLSACIIPYALELAKDPDGTMNGLLRTGVNVRAGAVVHSAVAKAHNL